MNAHAHAYTHTRTYRGMFTYYGEGVLGLMRVFGGWWLRGFIETRAIVRKTRLFIAPMLEDSFHVKQEMREIALMRLRETSNAYDASA